MRYLNAANIFLRGIMLSVFLLMGLFPLSACTLNPPNALETPVPGKETPEVSESEPVAESEPGQQNKPTQKDYAASIVEAKIQQDSLRDPFVLHYDGKYYIYGTGWTVGWSDDFAGPYSAMVGCVIYPKDYVDCCWAPEVYYYNDQFYMFTTYRSSKSNHRGCAVFVSDKPEGPFVLHSDVHVTPDTWDCIDGTLYIDGDGQPWMVFVHEWTSTDDGFGRMACAKLSEDLSEFISEPVELFRSNDPSWAFGTVTDGCFMYQTEGGPLLMLWSTMDNSGYCVAIARSESGDVTGPWTHEESRLYSWRKTFTYDGGHGMIFTDDDGQMWLAIHSPNQVMGERAELPVFVPIKEEDDTLIWDLERPEHGAHEK